MFPYVLPKKIGGLTAILILNSNPSAAATFSGSCTVVAACPTYYVANSAVQVESLSEVSSNIRTWIPGCRQGYVHALSPYGPGSSSDLYGICLVLPTCTECEDGYTLQDGTFPVTSNIMSSTDHHTISCTSIGGYEYKVCERNSTEPDPDPGNCVSDTTWVAHTVQGYEKLTTRTWNGTRCVESTQYRCAMDWYGNPGTSATGCQHCPADTIFVWNPDLGKTEAKIVAGKTLRAGTTQITQCVIDGYTTADNSGVFDYTTSCGWVQ